ncbi:MAG: hypothetical protein D6E12_00820 [Desulfovibrio sp.]|nr:MAG: hypothetical protein D6E12_00820 [Desulfovibrio sp.]
MLKRPLFCLALPVLATLMALPAWAGGSFHVDQLWPLLEQQPAVAQWVAQGLELNESGFAMRIGQEVNPNLGGMRVGPYMILAKPKDSEGPFTLELTIETHMECLDESGNPVDIDKAVTINETFKSLTVRPFLE